MTAPDHRATLIPMRRVAALGLLCLPILLACEPKTPKPRSEQPSKPVADATTQTKTPDEPAPEATPADELPAVEGVHYLEVVTAGADPNAELPMIVAIHGLGDSPEGFQNLLASFDRPARVILPRALDPYEPGWSWFPFRARDPNVEALAKGIEHAADTLAPAIAKLTQQRPTKGKPIVTGFSQGGMLTFTLAVHHGELFEAAFPVGGWLPSPLWPKPDADPELAPPIVAFHGDEDRAVKLEPTQEAVTHLQKAGYQVQLNVYPGVGHAIPPDMHADLLEGIRAALEQPEGE